MTDDLERLINDLRGPDFWQAFTHGGGALSDRQSSAPFRAADAIARLRAENEALREALGPFAGVADTLDEVGRAYEDDDRVNIVQAYGCLLAEMTEDEFRRARQALQEGSRHEG
jgi:hypothetical protein